MNSGAARLGHYLIYFILTFGIGYLPVNGLPELGVKILGVFFGMLYGWTFIGFMWPSMISLVALGLTGYASPDKVITSAFGNPAIVFTTFVLVFTRYLEKSGLNDTMAKWFLSRQIFAGRPWLFMCSVLLSTFIIGFLMHGLPTVFIICGILYSIFQDIHMKQGDDYPAYLLAGVYIAGVLTFAGKPWAGQILMATGSLAEMSGGTATVPPLALIGVTFPVCFAILIVYVIMVRVLFRPDAHALANLTPQYLGTIRDKIRMDKQQYIASFVLVIFLTLMLIPNILHEGPMADFFNKFGMVAAITLILGILSASHLNGRPIFDFQECSKGISWNIVWMVAASLPISAALSSKDAGISHILTIGLQSFSSSNILAFIVVIVVFISFMSQFMHNITSVIIAVPIVWNLSQILHFNPSGVLILVFLAAGAAFATPAASSIGALSFANGDWVGMKRAFRAGITGWIVSLFCILVIGIPLLTAFGQI